MSYAKRRAEGKSPSEVYAEIRKKKTEEALKTGDRWIVTSDGVPMYKFSTKQSQELAVWLLHNSEGEDMNRIRFLNILSGVRITIQEMSESRKLGVRS